MQDKTLTASPRPSAIASTGATAAGMPTCSSTMPRVRESALRARGLVRDCLESWELPELADTAGLVLSELVANAAAHASGASIHVTIARIEARRVLVAVIDMDHKEPRIRFAGPEDEDGRGLQMVALMSTLWGVDRLTRGKRVWAELTPEP